MSIYSDARTPQGTFIQGLMVSIRWYLGYLKRYLAGAGFAQGLRILGGGSQRRVGSCVASKCLSLASEILHLVENSNTEVDRIWVFKEKRYTYISIYIYICMCRYKYTYTHIYTH